MAASNDDSVVAHSSLPAASRVSPSSVVCSTTPLAQTFPQLAQHVVERGALTHSHDSERSSLCSQRGSLARALSSLRSASLSLFALLSPFRFAFILFRELPRFRSRKSLCLTPFSPNPRHKSLSPEQSERPHTSLCSRAANFFRCANALGSDEGTVQERKQKLLSRNLESVFCLSISKLQGEARKLDSAWRYLDLEICPGSKIRGEARNLESGWPAPVLGN
jgi:hypothetical protein